MVTDRALIVVRLIVSHWSHLIWWEIRSRRLVIWSLLRVHLVRVHRRHSVLARMLILVKHRALVLRRLV